MILTHYTRTIEAVAGILTNGFAWAPLPRNLIRALVPNHDWGNTEPQQYGMISFTDHQPPAPRNHRHDFGNFGIQVQPSWAEKNGAARVTYLETRGAHFEEMKDLFARGYMEVSRAIRYPDDGMWRMAYVYKSAASFFGAPLWARALSIYEYLEPAEHAHQREWRLVHPTGVGNLSRDTSQRIKNVSPPKGWGKYLHVLPVLPDDILGFVCPRPLCDRLREQLPQEFRQKKVAAYDA